MPDETDNPLSADDVQAMVDAALGSQGSSDDQDSADADQATATMSEAAPAQQSPGRLDLLGDVDLHVKIELGRTQMLVEDVLRLSEGSVVELNKLAGDPVDVYVNDRLIARGEVLVLSDNFCIRVSEIVADLEEQAQEAAQQAGGGA